MYFSIKIKLIILIVLSTLALTTLDYLFNYQSKVDIVIVKMSFLIVLLTITNYFVQREITEPISRLHEIIENLKDGNIPEINKHTNEHNDIDLIKNKFLELIALFNTRQDDLLSKIRYHEDILQSLMLSIIITDKTFLITYCNPMAERIFGINTKEVIGHPLISLHAKEKERFDNVINNLQREERYSYMIRRVIDNKIVNLESTISTLKDKNGELQGYILTTTTISDMARQQSRLHLQNKISKILVESTNMEEGLREVLKVICEGMMWDHGEIFITDKKSGYLKYDIRWSSGEGKERDEINNDYNEAKNTIIFEIRAREQKIGSMTFTSKVLYNFDDELRQTLESISKLIGVFVEKQESEDNNKLYSELLLKKNKELEEFAYVASHDLQQPLRLITGFSQLLESRLENKLSNEEKELLTYIVDSVNRMQNLIDDLLSYSRLTTNVKPFSIVRLKDIIETAIGNIQHQIDDTGAKFVFDDSMEFIEIYCDQTQMVQVFQNLFDNAIKYRQINITPDIKIGVKKADDRVIVSVSDNGIGFDIAQSERIFKIFQRLHSDDKYPGTGIGLSICKKIIERHQGSIWVESEVGKGSTFYISLITYPK